MTILIEFDCTHTRCCTTHWANSILWEANDLTIIRSYQHLALAIGQCHTNQTVALTQTKCDNTIRTWTAIRLQCGLLHQTILSSEDEVVVVHIFLIIEVLDMNECTHLVSLLDIDHVLECTTLRLAVALWNIVNLNPIETTLLGEEHHGRVHIRLVYILDEVLIACSTCFSTYSTTTLLTELGQWGTLDITQVRDSDNHIIVGIHILWIELSSHLDDTCTTLVCIFLLDLNQFVLNYLVTLGLVVEQLIEVLNEFLKFSILLLQLFNTQACELR